MSRIQDILSKAERDGTARRTRALSDEYASRPADEGVQARAFVDSAPAARTLHDEARLRSPEPPREAPPIPDASRSRPCGVPSRRSGRREPGIVRRRARAPADRAGRQAGHLPAYAPAIEGTPRVIARARPSSGRGAGADVAGRRAVPIAAHAPQARRERPRAAHHRRHQPEQGRRQEPDRRQPGADDGAGVPAARAAASTATCAGRRVHRLFGLADGPGLGDVLMSAAELDDALVALPEYHLTVLPAGAAARAIRRSCSGRPRCAACSTRCARASTAS